MAITRIDVSTKSIQQLMDKGEIPSGRYWLPSFQRSYVWDSGKVKELLHSIFHNYPIGSVILWRPSSRDIFDIDPTALPLMDIGNNSQEPHFIIDGQQRITSLLLMFNGWCIKRNGIEVKCDPISYVYSSDVPGSNPFIKSAHRGIDFSKIVKAFCLYDTETLAEFKQTTPPDVFERIRAMAMQLLKYQVSQYVMQTDIEDGQTFEDMANAFIRINKEGVKISNIELLLSFLAGTIGGDLKQRIVDIDKNMRDRFEATPQPTMRFIFSNFGLKQTQLSNAKRFKPNIEHIKAIKESERDTVLTRSAEALNPVLEFLKTEVGIKSAWFLPSQVTLVPLATYMYRRGITSVASLSEGEKRGMIRWFILANFMGHYGTAADSRLNRDLQTITDNASEHFPFKELVDNMPAGRRQISYDDIRKGLYRSVLLDAGKRYLFLLYILLIRKGANDWTGILLSARNRSDLERHHIFPQEHLRKIFPEWEDADPDDVEVEMSNLGNITWILGSENVAIGANDPADYLPRYIVFAKDHFVPEDQRFWKKKGFEAFKEYRIREIYLSGKQLFTEIFTDENPNNLAPDIKNGPSVDPQTIWTKEKYLKIAEEKISNKWALKVVKELYDFSFENFDRTYIPSNTKVGRLRAVMSHAEAKEGLVSLYQVKNSNHIKIAFGGIKSQFPGAKGEKYSKFLLDKLFDFPVIQKWYKITDKKYSPSEWKRWDSFIGTSMQIEKAIPDEKALVTFKAAILEFKKEIQRTLSN